MTLWVGTCITYFESKVNHSFLSSGELKAATQLVMGHPGQPRTKVVSEGRLHSVMSETLSETHISERRSWSFRLKTFCGVLLEFVVRARKMHVTPMYNIIHIIVHMEILKVQDL